MLVQRVGAAPLGCEAACKSDDPGKPRNARIRPKRGTDLMPHAPASVNDERFARHELGLGEEGVLDSALPQPVEPTLYARFRDGPAGLAVLAVLAIALWRRRSARRL